MNEFDLDYNIKEINLAILILKNLHEFTSQADVRILIVVMQLQ